LPSRQAGQGLDKAHESSLLLASESEKRRGVTLPCFLVHGRDPQMGSGVQYCLMQCLCCPRQTFDLAANRFESPRRFGLDGRPLLTRSRMGGRFPNNNNHIHIRATHGTIKCAYMETPSSPHTQNTTPRGMAKQYHCHSQD
jgi:hypothetical protein